MPRAWSFSGLVGATENSSKREWVGAPGAQGRGPLTPQEMLFTPLAGRPLGGVGRAGR